MGVIEQHHLERSSSIFDSENTPNNRYKRSLDEHIKLPTLSTRYGSSYYIKSAQKNKVQVIVKIVSKASGSTCINRLGDYISRDISKQDLEILGRENEGYDPTEKLFLEDENGNIYYSKEERRGVINEWSVDFKSRDSLKKQEWKEQRIIQMKQELNNLKALIVAGKATTEQKKEKEKLSHDIEAKKYEGMDGKIYDLNIYLPKDTTHMVLSVGGKIKSEQELKKADIAVREYLNKNFGEIGHRYLFTAHNDTDNLHYHVIIKNCNELDQKSLRLDRADLFMLRQSFAKELEQVGYERGAELRIDREHSLEKIALGFERVQNNQTWYQSKLSQGKDADFDAFAYRAKALNKTNFLLGALRAEEKYTSFFELSKFGKIGNLRHEITSFKKKLITILPNQLDQEKKALEKNLEKESAFISKKIKHIESFEFESMQEMIKKKNEKQIQSVSHFLGTHQDRLKKEYVNLGKKHESFFEKLFDTAALNKEKIRQISLSKDKGRGIDITD